MTPVPESRLDFGIEDVTAGDDAGVDCAVDGTVAAPPRPFTMKLPSPVSEELNVLPPFEESDRLADKLLSNPDPPLDPALLSRLYADAKTEKIKSLMKNKTENAMTEGRQGGWKQRKSLKHRTMQREQP